MILLYLSGWSITKNNIKINSNLSVNPLQGGFQKNVSCITTVVYICRKLTPLIGCFSHVLDKDAQWCIMMYKCTFRMC